MVQYHSDNQFQSQDPRTREGEITKWVKEEKTKFPDLISHFCSNYVLSAAISQTPNICHPFTAGWCWEKGKEERVTVFIFTKFMADKTGM